MTDPSSEVPSEPTDQDVISDPSAETTGVSSLEDAVNAALGETSEESPTSAEPGSTEPAPDKPEEEAEVSDEELKQYSKGAQRRIRELVDARRNVEGEKATLQTEIEAIKPKAERMDQLLGYMRANSVAPEHLDNALGMTALINSGQYDKALPILENLLQQVRSAAGEVLPEDLQKRVNLGYISEQDAKELHKSKLSGQRTEERAKQDRERIEQERHQRETQTLVNTAVTTAEAWHKEQVASDPDWNLKRDLVTQRMELELLRLGPQGYPRNPEAVRKLLGDAKAAVEQEIRRFKPAPRAINPSPTGNSASSRSKAKPASLMDAVNMALADGE